MVTIYTWQTPIYWKQPGTWLLWQTLEAILQGDCKKVCVWYNNA